MHKQTIKRTIKQNNEQTQNNKKQNARQNEGMLSKQTARQSKEHSNDQADSTKQECISKHDRSSDVLMSHKHGIVSAFETGAIRCVLNE